MSNILLLASEGDKRMLRGLLHLSKNDVECIWTEISFYIRRQMNLQKGVNLSGLGTFTFSLQNFNTGHRFSNFHHPIFILAGKLSQSLGLHQVRWLAKAAHVPVVPLNFAAVSQQTPYSRDVVEGCVRETLAALHRALASERHIFLPLKGIGVLSFRNNKVQMKFSRDFINTISETHQTLKDSSMRAGSSGSLSSAEVTELQRPQTACRVSLPAIVSLQTDNKGIGKDGGNVLPSGDQRSKKEVLQQRESKFNQSLQTKAVGLTEELNPIPPAVPTSSVLHGESPKLVQHLKNVSSSGQIPAERELCHLCTQRALRNVPENRRERRDAEEKAHGNLLLLKEQLRDEQEMEQELAKLTEQHEQAKKVAAFNLHMSRREKSSRFDCPRSFVFPARPVTPPKRIRQHRYGSDLRSQMERRQQLVAQDQQYRLLTERLDQMQLIQEIALQRAQQLQKKLEKTKHYRKALDAQVEDKMFTSCSECPPDKPRLTRCETAIRRAESRKRAQKLFQANFGVATQRKREEMQNRQLQLETEKEMLKHTKTELMRDATNHFEKKRAVRKSLEDDWSRSAELKHKREDEERRFLRSPGKLLVDKLEECQRCWRCKRRTTNCGETNIWKDSRYLSGSQFMI
ncbi:coiled-coil domain-containing protein 81 isoform X2 [Poecilia latipinna]|uniref:coiled-coil domain-containing protein 81 isoform X2 n=1 Tax=Poecilia latipinna TaxID=48699 RepID=UPI00072EC35C|nr:PREDICTED: coiled-coil domain-containing protein 81 isoform X2 [Poecilia latipinna]